MGGLRKALLLLACKAVVASPFCCRLEFVEVAQEELAFHLKNKLCCMFCFALFLLVGEVLQVSVFFLVPDGCLAALPFLAMLSS